MDTDEQAERTMKLITTGRKCKEGECETVKGGKKKINTMGASKVRYFVVTRFSTVHLKKPDGQKDQNNLLYRCHSF